jgi:hypothetical protein
MRPVALARQRTKTCRILVVKPGRGKYLKFSDYSGKIILKWPLMK